MKSAGGRAGMERKMKTHRVLELNYGRRRPGFAPLLLALCLALLTLSAGLTPAGAAAQSDAVNAAVDKLVDYGVLRGGGGGMYLDRSLTRCEFVAMVNRAYGYDAMGEMPFTDVPVNEWFYDDINIGYNTGYFEGTSGTTADPWGTLTREQAVVMLGRSLRAEQIPGQVAELSDGDDVSTWAMGYIRAAAQAGLIDDDGGKGFRPQELMTRGEMAELLSNALGDLVLDAGSHSLGDVGGNVTIREPGTTLSNTTVAGDLIISGGVGLGDVTLSNVRVLGKIVVAGGGASEDGGDSVTLRNVQAGQLVVDTLGGQFVSLLAEGDTAIPDAVIRNSAFIQDNTDGGGLANLVLDSDEEEAVFSLGGNIGSVVNNTPGSVLNFANGVASSITVGEEAVDSTVNIEPGGTVRELNLETGAEVTGGGDIDHLQVNAADTDVEMLPDRVDVRPGVTSNVAGMVLDTKLAQEVSADPRLLANFPRVKNVAPTSATAVFSANKAGTIHWAVSRARDGSIGESELMEPLAYGSKALKQGTVPAAASSSEVNVNISGLPEGADLVLSAILEDAQGRRSPLKTVSFKTPDSTVPAFTTGFPVMSKVTSNAAQVGAATNKSCMLYYALYRKDAAAPTKEDFITGSLSGSVSHGSREMTKNVPQYFYVNSGALEEVTDYDLYLWLTDADGNQSSAVRKLSFTTLDGTAPVITQPLDVFSRTATGLQGAVTVSEDATLFWVAVPAGSDYPVAKYGETPALSSESAKLQVATGRGAAKSGSADVKGDTEATLAISGLEAGTSYDIYYVARDKAGNYSDPVLMLAGITTNDGTALAFNDGYPKVDNITNISAELYGEANKNALLYYVVLPAGAAGPTMDELKNGKVSGGVGGGTIALSKNIEDHAMANDEDLEEITAYDVYAMLTTPDGSERTKVVKLTFTTADKTPPDYTQELTINQVQATSLRGTVRINEPGTIYWVAVKNGATYPKPAQGQTDPPDLNSDEAKHQVANGMNCLKYGKVTAKSNTDATINITGLTAETPYDIYYLAQDESGNYAEWVKVLENVYTQDNRAPTVTQEFSHLQEDGTKVYPDSDVDIIFSESVRRESTNQSLLDSYNNRNRSDEAMQTFITTLQNTIQLYDDTGRSQLVSPRDDDDTSDDWTIDYREAQVSKDPDTGEVIVHFPNKEAINLGAGRTYHFHIKDIEDENENAINKNGIDLNRFVTMSAQVYLEALALKDYDVSFSLTPEATGNVPEDTLWDMIIWADTTVSFDLLRRVNGGEWKPVGSADITSTDGGYNARSLTHAIKTGEEKDDFKSITTDLQEGTVYEYAIQIKSVDGNQDRGSWSETVHFRVNLVAGGNNDLKDLGSNPTDRYLNLVGTGKPLSEIGIPTTLELKAPFSDDSPLYFTTIYPQFKQGAGSVDVQVMLDRSGTVYWAVAPVEISTATNTDGTVSITGATPSITTRATESIYNDASGTKVNFSDVPYEGSTDINSLKQPKFLLEDPGYLKIVEGTTASGSDKIKYGHASAGDSLTTISISGLDADQWYYAYFVLRGSDQNYSPVYVYKFKTDEVKKPIVTTTQNSKTEARISVDSPATVDYALIRLDELEKTWLYSPFTGYAKKDSYSTDTATAEFRKNGEATVLDAIRQQLYDSSSRKNLGSVFELYATDDAINKLYSFIHPDESTGSSSTMHIGTQQFKSSLSTMVDCTKWMELGPQYVFIAMAYNSASSDYSFHCSYPYELVDTTPPRVTNANYAFDHDADSDKINGVTVYLTFDKPLYIKNPDEDSPTHWIAVTRNEDSSLDTDNAIYAGDILLQSGASSLTASIVPNPNASKTGATIGLVIHWYGQITESSKFWYTFGKAFCNSDGIQTSSQPLTVNVSFTKTSEEEEPLCEIELSPDDYYYARPS